MKTKIEQALSSVNYPGFSKDIMTLGFVKDIRLQDKKAFIDLEITASAKEISDTLRSQITQVLSSLDLECDVSIKTPANEEQKIKNIAPNIKNFVMISSGKGGVGKSTSTVNLAIAMASRGKKVGILDADIYGPNIARMLGKSNDRPDIRGEKIVPLNAHGIEFVSMANLVEEGQSLIWRGAMIMKVIVQLLQDVLWSELDVLFIDMPPGTGDAQLTLAQSVPVNAGVVVTTPQVVALDDAKRSLDMFKKLHIPIAGVIENMSGFVCPESSKEYDIFGKGTALDLARQYSCDVLGEIPIELAIRQGSDSGTPITISHPSSTTSAKYAMASDMLSMFLDEVEKNEAANNAQIQPTM